MTRWSRPWVGAESRLLSEWLATKWAGFRVIVHVRLGRVPIELAPEGLTQEQARMVGVWRRWADAVVVRPDRLMIVEAGIVPAPGDVSQIEYYLRLAPDTPELAEWVQLPLQAHLLYATRDPVVEQMAVERGITVETWTPSWIVGYLSARTLRGLP